MESEIGGAVSDADQKVISVVASDGQHRKSAKHLFYTTCSTVTCQSMEEKLYQLFPASGVLVANHMEEKVKEKVNVLIDGGATFDAISPRMAEIMGYEVEVHEKPLCLRLGGAQNTEVQRRVTQLCLRLQNLPDYNAYCFVMPLPEGKDVLLGTPWHRSVNADINWEAETITPRIRRACRVGGKRVWKKKPRAQNIRHNMLFQQLEFESGSGPTKFVDIHKKRAMKRLLSLEEGEFAFYVRVAQPDSEKAARQLGSTWESLRDNPAYEICLKYKDSVFKQELPKEAPRPDTLKAVEKHSLELEDSSPIHVKQFRLSPEQRTAIENWISEMLEAGIIRPSESPFCAPTFAVRKAVGWRIVHDYRRINQRTIIPQPVTLRKEDILDSMSGSYWFSTCDLLHGYYQQYMDPDSVQYTAFSTHLGQFEYLVMPQGLSGAPGSFNRLVQKIFKDMRDIVRVYFDDAFIFTKSESIEDHLIALDRFLARCASEQLYLKLSKCVFCAEEIPVLGDFVGRHGVRMDPDKVKVIQEWPIPTTKTEVKQFVGTIAYNQKFIKNFGELVAPLHTATQGKTKNQPIVLTPHQLKCFQSLKDVVSSAPVLALPDWSRDFLVRMDASDFAIGGALIQIDAHGDERVVAYTGRKLSAAELNYDTRERELLAVLLALRKWRVYLLDKPFVVETDHHSLQSLLSQKSCSRRLARWLHELSEFSPRFKWIAGSSNTLADGLSRRPDFAPRDGRTSSVGLRDYLSNLLTELNEHQFQYMDFFYHNSPLDIEQCCRDGYKTDPVFAPIVEAFLQGGRVSTEFRNFKWNEIQKLLWFSPGGQGPWRLCVPNHEDLRNQLLYLAHDDPTCGHPGVFKTTHHLQKHYYWKHMNTFIAKYIRSCEKCQRNKTLQQKPFGELQCHTVPESRWTEISMDFITSLPQTARGNNMIWVIVDRLTKRIHLIPVKDTITTKELMGLFRREYQRLHGLPKSIVSDRDKLFNNKIWTPFMSFVETELKMSSAHRSSVDGQTEIVNRFVEDYIRNYVNAYQQDWDQFIDLAEFAYSSRLHSTIGMCPFEADLGYIPRSSADIEFEKLCRDDKFSEARDFLLEQQVRLETARTHMAEAQQRMAHYYNKNRPVQDFEIGDLVLLSTKHLSLAHSGVAKEGSRKFGPKRIGPFKVLEKVKKDSYRLQLPTKLKLHDCFHTSLLYPYVPSDSDSRLNPPSEGVLLPDGEIGYIVEKIVGLRTSKGVEFAKVRWQGFGSKHDTWEPVSELSNVFELIDAYRSSRRQKKKS